MKKWFALLVSLVLLMSVTALADEGSGLYDALLSLTDGHSCTLNVRIEDADVEDGVIPFETAALSLNPESKGIRLTGMLNGEQMLDAWLDAEGFRFECSLITDEPQSWTWAELPPTVQLIRDENGGFSLTVRATGSQHELINLNMSVSGSAEEYEGEFGFTLLMAGGEIYSLWDVFSASEGTSATEVIVGLQHDIGLTGEGTETVERGEDGTLTVSRTESCIVTVDDDEAGTATLITELAVR